MSIKSIKVTMDPVTHYSGNISGRTIKRTVYMPSVTITYNEKTKSGKNWRKKHFYSLENDFVDKEDYYEHALVGESYFALLHCGVFKIYNENCELQGSVSVADIGDVFQVSEDFFVCKKGDVLTIITDTGQIAEQRTLTQQEKEWLDAEEAQQKIP